jgi:hypothetical protein
LASGFVTPILMRGGSFEFGESGGMDSETIKASAKATEEVAKTAGKALDFAQGFPAWIGDVVGRPIAEAVGYYVTDRIQAKRYEAAIYDQARLTELVRKVGIALEGRDVKVRPIPPKVALPLLENATMEFDERLHTMWANLLASALDADQDPVERQYVTVLAELFPPDAMALEEFWSASFKLKTQKPLRDGAVTYLPTIDTTGHEERVAANLTRLGLLTSGYMQLQLFRPNEGEYGEPEFSSSVVEVPTEPSFAHLTDLGRGFCLAVGMKVPAEA